MEFSCKQTKLYLYSLLLTKVYCVQTPEVAFPIKHVFCFVLFTSMFGRLPSSYLHILAVSHCVFFFPFCFQCENFTGCLLDPVVFIYLICVEHYSNNKKI